MQPVQLSLIPDPGPASSTEPVLAPPPAQTVERLPADAVSDGDHVAGQRDRQGGRARRASRWSAMSESKVTRCASASRRGGLCAPVHHGPAVAATGSPPPASTTWSRRRGRAGLAAQRGAGDRRRPRRVRGQRQRAGPGSPSWPRRSGSVRWESCWRWRFRGWPATTPTGTGCWIWPG